MKKFIFYITLSALCVFWAEVVSTNLPGALFNPFVYIAYGLLYIFFIDALIRWRSKDFKIFYLFGVLIGLITETYIAKVTFYGLKPDEVSILGVSPGAIMFVILFYHAFFSFLAPTYMAKRILNIPLVISKSKRIDFLYLIVPFMLSPVYAQVISGELTALRLSTLMGISAIILTLWIFLLKVVGDIKNILLSKKERTGLFIMTLLLYTIFLFTGTNPVHGHSPTDFPVIPMTGVTIIIILLLTLTHKSLKKGKKPEEEISYSPGSINFPLFFTWLFWHLSVTAIFLFLQNILRPISLYALPMLAIFGVLTGVWAFLFSVTFLLKNLITGKS